MFMDLAKRILPQDTKYPVIIDEALAQFIRVAHVLPTGPLMVRRWSKAASVNDHIRTLPTIGQGCLDHSFIERFWGLAPGMEPLIAQVVGCRVSQIFDLGQLLTTESCDLEFKFALTHLWFRGHATRRTGQNFFAGRNACFGLAR